MEQEQKQKDCYDKYGTVLQKTKKQKLQLHHDESLSHFLWMFFIQSNSFSASPTSKLPDLHQQREECESYF